jgi:hypothetical protein
MSEGSPDLYSISINVHSVLSFRYILIHFSGVHPFSLMCHQCSSSFIDLSLMLIVFNSFHRFEDARTRKGPFRTKLFIYKYFTQKIQIMDLLINA